MDILKFVQMQNARIKEIAMDEEFAHINYAELVPVSTDGGEWASAVALISTEGVGKAEFINGNADDVPIADAVLGGTVAPVHMAAIGYAYGLQEINQARAMGIDLTARKAIAARLAYEEHMQEVALIGSKEKGLLGIFNQANANVTRDTDNTNWANATAAEALVLVNKAIALTGVKGRPTADTVILPYALFEKLAGMISDAGAKTGLQYIAENNIAAATGRKVTILSDLALDTAATGNKPRILAYRRNPDVVELAIPMPHQFLDVFKAGPLRYEVPGIARTAGVHVSRKRDFAYLDSTA